MTLLVDCAANIKQTTGEAIIKEAGTKLIGKSSIKAALDIDWSVLTEKKNAINTLMNDVESLKQWLKRQPTDVTEHKELKESLTLLEHVISQNIDTDPEPGCGAKVTQGTVVDRQISIVDKQMRYGRKSSSRTINGYKQHIAIDMDTKLILATCVRPANEPEFRATKWLQPKVGHYC